MKKTFRFTASLALGFLMIVMAGYLFGAGQLIELFMKNEQIVAYGTAFLRAMSLVLPFLCMDFLAVGVFQACGMGSKALVFAILRKIVLEIPLLYLLNWLFPLYGLAYAQTAAEIILAIAAVFVLVRLFRQLEQEFKPRKTDS